VVVYLWRQEINRLSLKNPSIAYIKLGSSTASLSHATEDNPFFSGFTRDRLTVKTPQRSKGAGRSRPLEIA